MQFIDTNIFLRHLTGDDPKKAQACFELFQKAQRKEISLTTSEAVIAEVVYVLESAKQIYSLNRDEIRQRLNPLLSLPGLKLTNRKMYLRALHIYAAHALDFEDALTVAHMEQWKIDQVYSYDRDFDRIMGIKRLEP